MLNLDTHVLVFAFADELTRRERFLLERDRWSVSAIVHWELVKLAELGRIKLDLDDAEVRRALSRIHVWPIDMDVCRAIRRLDFRGDPADELIAATSLLHNIPLVTRDRRIRKSRVVPLARA